MVLYIKLVSLSFLVDMNDYLLTLIINSETPYNTDHLNYVAHGKHASRGYKFMYKKLVIPDLCHKYFSDDYDLTEKAYLRIFNYIKKNSLPRIMAENNGFDIPDSIELLILKYAPYNMFGKRLHDELRKTLDLFSIVAMYPVPSLMGNDSRQTFRSLVYLYANNPFHPISIRLRLHPYFIYMMKMSQQEILENSEKYTDNIKKFSERLLIEYCL